MHPNQALLKLFYQAFARRNAAVMDACYHPEATFTDPVFRLRGEAIGQMWQMLCERSTDLRIAHGDLDADAHTGRARWEAHYTFSQTGRPVHNCVQAEFGFRDGLIVRHADHFGFWRWARQALGAPGWMLGWSPLLKNRVRATAQQNLDNFMARRQKL